MDRPDGRKPDELRKITITTGVQEFAEGSVLVETGRTRVLCAVSVEESVPRFLAGSDQGWVTAEYSMLPRSTVTRNPREARTGGPKGRTQEIQRLIGRSLRAAADLSQLGERTFIADCDVLLADGGTRTAAITGAYVALHLSIEKLGLGSAESSPLKCAVAATSVGVVDGMVVLDLNYEEDVKAAADFNVVMTDQGEFVEVQGTAEDGSFSREALDEVLDMARVGIDQLFEVQKQAIGRS